MADSETPMFTDGEVRQRRRGLYWLVALFALIVLAMVTFGLTDQEFEDRGSIFDSGTVTPNAAGVTLGDS